MEQNSPLNYVVISRERHNAVGIPVGIVIVVVDKQHIRRGYRQANPVPAAIRTKDIE
jgi:hypothetical protein